MSDAEAAESEPKTAELPGLPPVEPPSAGFIVQLFIVPAVIVVVIVMIWLSFSWLAHLGEDPATYIRQLKNRDWHAAYNLAQSLLQSQHNKALVENRVYAQEVADVLTAEMAQKSFEPEAVMFRQYLCSSLGFFHVDTGLPALMEAAETQRDDREIPVRCAALVAIRQLALNLQQADPPQKLDGQNLLDVLTAAAEDDARFVEPADEQNGGVQTTLRVRERAVHALGALGTEQANLLLKEFLDSSEPNVRYNATTGLAGQGIATQRSIDVLVEMLDPDAGLAAETTDQAKAFKRQGILNAACPAIERLIASDTEVDLSPLVAPLQTLADQTDITEVQLKAKSLLIELRKRTTS